MNIGLVEKIANAVLYEGYILYPYRPSATKNRQRWNFGALYPQRFGLASKGTDAWTMRTECLVQGSGQTALDVKVRFLHLLGREVSVSIAECGMRSADWGENDSQSSISDFDFGSNFRRVASLEVGGQVFHSWQEAVEREVSAPGIRLDGLVGQSQKITFAFASSRELEPLRDERAQIVGVVVREQQHIEGAIELSAERGGDGLFKITVNILNLTPFSAEHSENRDEALMRAFVSTHTILGVRGGEFISLLEPPEAFRESVAGCHNTGTYPVLVGEAGERDMMLSSPIILYDYPQIAPESAGDFFDGTEMDEMLTLRVMTLTDDEKREMRAADQHARRILERTETLPSEHLMKLHGAVRGIGKKT